MLKEERMRRQEELEKRIKRMAERVLEENDIRKIALDLKDIIYNGDFRHCYSGFFPIILEISKEDNDYTLDFLSENIEALRCYIEDDYIIGTNEFDNISGYVDKLCDHINLEIGRLNYYMINDNKIKDMETKTLGVNAALSEATGKLKEASEKASTMQTELIAVLSIFAAIVITFSGGLSFLGSAMASMNNKNHYEAIIMVTIICGIVIFNTIFLMMYLVSKITERNIYAKCITPDCFNCNGEKCGGITRIRKRLPYVFYFNIMAIIGIVIDLIIWLFDIKGILS